MKRVSMLLLAGLSGLFGACQAGNSPFEAEGPDVVIRDFKTTSSNIAISNLRARIRLGETELAEAPEDIALRSELVELHLVMARNVGQLTAFDRVWALAEEAVDGAPQEAKAWLLRGRVQAALHRFQDAQDDLQQAEDLGADPVEVDAVRWTIDIALGRVGALDGPAPTSLGPRVLRGAALASLGRYEEADFVLVAAIDGYRDVSPFPVAAVYFQRGVMWAERAGHGPAGRRLYEAAVRHLPQFVTAQVHLAEQERGEGQLAQAAARLETLWDQTDDPEPYGLLASLHAALGNPERAQEALERAEAGYEVLLAKYPEAFWDHASEFYRGPGNDPTRALQLALANLENRPTERAVLLAIDAALDAGETSLACELASDRAPEAPVTAPLQDKLLELVAICR